MTDDHLARRVAEIAAHHKVPGGQLGVQTGDETWLHCFGVRAAEADGLVSADSAFAFGSLSKPFLAVLTMLLVADGDLDLESPASDYVPEIGQAQDGLGGKVTLRELLNHTSGLESDFLEESRLLPMTLARYAKHLGDLSFVTDPSALFSYSNTGYLVVARAIEAVCGLDWWEALEAFVAGPLNMGLSSTAGPHVRSLTGHSVVEGRVRPTLFGVSDPWTPAGGLVGGAADLLRLAGAAKELDLPEAMFSVEPTADGYGLSDGWGLGWARYQRSETSWWGHDGTVDGFTANLRFEPETDTAVALVTNASSGLLLWRDLLPLLANAGLDVADHEVPMPPLTPLRPPMDCEGRYGAGHLELTVEHTPSGTVIRDELGESTPIAMYDELSFVTQPAGAADTPDLGRFLRTTTDTVIDSLQLGGRCARRLTS